MASLLALVTVVSVLAGLLSAATAAAEAPPPPAPQPSAEAPPPKPLPAEPITLPPSREPAFLTPALPGPGPAQASLTTHSPTVTRLRPDAAATPKGDPGSFRLSDAVAGLLEQQLHLHLGDTTLTGTVSGHTLTVGLAPPDGLAFDLPGGLGALSFGPVTVTIDLDTGNLMLAISATTSNSVEIAVEVQVAHADNADGAKPGDITMQVQITGVSFFGSTIDLTGTLTYAAGGTFSGTLAATLTDDLITPDGLVTVKAGSTVRLALGAAADKEAGRLAVDLTIALAGEPGFELHAAGTISDLHNWSLAVSQTTTGAAWQPAPGLELAANLSGNLVNAGGRISFTVAADTPATWTPADGVTVVLNHVEVSNSEPSTSSLCPPITAGRLWLSATATVSYAPAELHVGGSLCVDPAAKTFRLRTDLSAAQLVPDGAGFTLDRASLTVTGDGMNRAGAVALSARLTITALAARPSFDVALAYANGVLVAGVELPSLDALGMSGGGVVWAASGAIDNFSPASVFPGATGTFDLGQGVSVTLAYRLPTELTKSLVSLGVLGADTDGAFQAVANLGPSGFAIKVSLAFGAETSGAQIFRKGDAGLYLNRITLGLQVGANTKVSVGGRATMTLPPARVGGTSSTVKVELNASFDFTNPTITFGFKLTGGDCGKPTCPWTDALGIPGLTVRNLAANFGVNLSGAVPVPTLAISVDDLSLPVDWANAIGLDPKAKLSFDFDLNATRPFVRMSLIGAGPNQAALRPLTIASNDTNVRNSFVVKEAKLNLAPLGGTTAAGETVRPGLSLVFDAIIVGRTTHVDASFDPIGLRLTANVAFGPLDVGPTRLPDARLALDVRPASFSFDFTGSFSDRGVRFDATISLRASTELANAAVSLKVVGGLPSYLQVSGALRGSVAVSSNGLALSAAGSGAIVVNNQRIAEVSFAYSASSGLGWQQLNSTADQIALSLRNLAHADATTIVAILTGVHFPQYEVVNALAAIGFDTNQFVNALKTAFNPSAEYLWTVNAQVLDVEGGSKADGARVIQYLHNYGANQKWVRVATSGGYVEIINVNSGKCLTAPGNSAGQVTQSRCDARMAQQWRFADAGSIYSYVKNRGSGMYLDLSGGKIAAGTPIIQWPYNGNSNQKFYRTGAVL